MAVVYLAQDERLDREVAVKRLHSESSEDVEIRFVREAKLGASLNHPNLVWVFDILTDEEGLVIVMEYVDGPNLGREVSRGPLSSRRAVEVLAATASALEHAHEHGIVHRDVKPANVLLGRDGAIKLADLGIATAADITRITRSDVALGTASYMAPEQLEGRKVTPATDIYALATVAFEVLSGIKARTGRTPVEVAHHISSEPPPDLRDVWDRAPREAAEVLSAAMARDPEERPASACDFVSELARALGEETTARLRLEAARAATGGAAAAGVPGPEAEPTLEPEPEPEPGPDPTPDPDPTPEPEPHPDPTPEPALAATPAPRPPLLPRRGQYQAPRRGRRLPAGLLAGAVALLAVILALVVLAGGGDDSGGSAAQRGQGSSQEPQGSSQGRRGAAAGDDAAGDQGGSSDQGGSGAQPGGTPSASRVPQPANRGGAAEGARLNRQGFALLNRGQAAQAVPVLTRSVEAFPPGTKDLQYAFALYNLGRALRLGGRPADAVPVLERRLRIPNQRSTVQKELDAARRAAG